MELKPCPFCGGRDLLPSFHSSKHETHVCVSCDACDAEGPTVIVRTDDRVEDIRRAWVRWNERQ